VLISIGASHAATDGVLLVPSLPAADACWIIESTVEAAESAQPGLRLLALPPASEWEGSLTTAEAAHLELFLLARRAGCTPASSVLPSLTAEPADPPAWLQAHRSYVGNPEPEVLLVGDQHNPANDISYAASFGPWAGCGPWLLGCLAPEYWRTIGLCNAAEGNVADLWGAIGCPPTVSLGRRAQDACAVAGVSSGTVPHPQYIRRFLHGQLDAYGKLITAVAETQEDLGDWRGQ